MPLFAIALLLLTGPGGQRIEINPQAVVSLREPRGQDHFAPEVRCLLHMNDGKIVTVAESCDQVSDKLREDQQE